MHFQFRYHPAALPEHSATVKVRYQVCKARTCLIPVTEELPVTFTVEAGAPRSSYAQAVTSPPQQPPTYQNYPAATPITSTAASPMNRRPL